MAVRVARLGRGLLCTVRLPRLGEACLWAASAAVWAAVVVGVGVFTFVRTIAGRENRDPIANGDEYPRGAAAA
jgi:hypothetical protein